MDIFEASLNGDIAKLDELLGAGSSVNTRDIYGRHPIMLAAAAGNMAAVVHLRTHWHARLSGVDEDGEGILTGVFLGLAGRESLSTANKLQMCKLLFALGTDPVEVNELDVSIVEFAARVFSFAQLKDFLISGRYGSKKYSRELISNLTALSSVFVCVDKADFKIPEKQWLVKCLLGLSDVTYPHQVCNGLNDILNSFSCSPLCVESYDFLNGFKTTLEKQLLAESIPSSLVDKLTNPPLKI